MNRIVWLVALLLAASLARAEGKIGKLPHVEFDVEHRLVRVECEALAVDAPLEFFCCVAGTNEHESVLRTSAKPSDINIGLIAIGLKPGKPLTYSESSNRWLPPQGPPLHITLQYEKDGRKMEMPAHRWLKNLKTRKSPPAFTWVYTGSRVMPDSKFAADVTGYVVSIVNFDLTLIDVPELASSSNETLEWERNAEVMPKVGAKVWMVIEPVGKNDAPAATQPSAAPAQSSTGPVFDSAPVLATAHFSPRHGQCEDPAPATAPATAPSADALSSVHLDEKQLDDLEKYWRKKVSPHAAALREAAEAHYKVITQLRHEQQRLIDEADRVQRAIDKLEKDYQDMTTPRPQDGQ